MSGTNSVFPEEEIETKKEVEPVMEVASPVEAEKVLIAAPVTNAELPPETAGSAPVNVGPQGFNTQKDQQHQEEEKGGAPVLKDEKDEPIYTQRDADEAQAILDQAQARLDQTQARLEAVERELKEKDAELKEKKDKIQDICRQQRHRIDLVNAAYNLVGDGSPARIHDFVEKFVDFQLDSGKVRKLESDLADVREIYKSTADRYESSANEVRSLANANRELNEQLSRKSDELASLALSNEELTKNLKSYKTFRDRLELAMIPKCLASKEWFCELHKELQAGLDEEPVSDFAMLVLSSLAEFAIMERNPAAACFDWKKQLADIGAVVAHYMHQKMAPEIDVAKMLQNFGQALCESETVAQLRIALKVPELGPDFNIEEVKHNKNGSAVVKILNWCIIDANGVYRKAIVE